jgi:signal transduction histidine kinase
LPDKTLSMVPARRTTSLTLVTIFSVYVAVMIRTLLRAEIRPVLLLYLAVEVLFLSLYAWELWHPMPWRAGPYLYFAFQSALILGLYLLVPPFDFVVVLFNMLSFQAALVFPGQLRWLWAGFWALLTAVLLTVELGIFGLAVALLPITLNFVFPAYVTFSQEIEARLRTNQVMLDELHAANQQLTAFSAQVEELSAIQERNHLAREMHDSVLKTIHDVVLHSRVARQLLESDADSLDSQLEQLQTLSQSGLDQMRSLITSLRPAESDSAERPTP